MQQGLGSLLAERHQLDAGHHRPFEPGKTVAHGQLAQGNRPMHGQPGHGTELGEAQAVTPGRDLCQLPTVEQSRQGGPALLLFQAQLCGFAIGQQESAPVGVSLGIAGQAGVVQADKHGPVQVREGVLDLFALPGCKTSRVLDPPCFNCPFQALRIGEAPDWQAGACQLQQPQQRQIGAHQPASTRAAPANSPPPNAFCNRA